MSCPNLNVFPFSIRKWSEIVNQNKSSPFLSVNMQSQVASIQEQFRKLELDGVDRISEMPDLILCKILSYLTTKNAVAASILSTRWKCLVPFWLPPVRLDLDDTVLLNSRMNHGDPTVCLCDEFVDFVDKLLNETLLNVPYLETISLVCNMYHGEDKIASWVCSALKLNVRELLFDVNLIESSAMFESLNGCTTLTRLELGKRFIIRLPDDFSLPNLKVLYLDRVVFAKDEGYFFNELIDGCPALVDLSVDGCNFNGLGYICIRAPLLKNLYMDYSSDNTRSHIRIDAPSLESLVYEECAARSYSLSRFKSVRSAVIGMGELISESADEEDDDEDPYYADGVAKFVTACSGTAYLYLTNSSIYGLHYSSMQLPAFQNLTSLAIEKVTGSGGWAILARLLCNAPILEELMIEEGFGKHKGGYSNFESLVPKPPTCFELHLKKIKLWIFKEDEDEIKLIEYFLKNGNAIKKLELHCLPCKDGSTLSRLRLLPGHSKIYFRLRKRKRDRA